MYVKAPRISYRPTQVKDTRGYLSKTSRISFYEIWIQSEISKIDFYGAQLGLSLADSNVVERILESFVTVHPGRTPGSLTIGNPIHGLMTSVLREGLIVKGLSEEERKDFFLMLICKIKKILRGIYMRLFHCKIFIYEFKPDRDAWYEYFDLKTTRKKAQELVSIPTNSNHQADLSRKSFFHYEIHQKFNRTLRAA